VGGGGINKTPKLETPWETPLALGKRKGNQTSTIMGPYKARCSNPLICGSSVESAVVPDERGVREHRNLFCDLQAGGSQKSQAQF